MRSSEFRFWYPDLDNTDCGDEKTLTGNETPDFVVLRLGRIDDDITVEEHQVSRPGSGRSFRISRCHSTGSEISENAFIAASFSRISTIRRPRATTSELVGELTMVTSTDCSAFRSVGAASVHSNRLPFNIARYVCIGSISKTQSNARIETACGQAIRSVSSGLMSCCF